MNDKELIQALRNAAVETGSLLCLGCGHEHNCGVHGCAIIRAAAERLEALTAPPNDPLTLEELREMGDEWVWIKFLVPAYGMESGYYIKKTQFSDADKLYCGYSAPNLMVGYLVYAGYGGMWLAYRRKPEELQPPVGICGATRQPCCRCQPGACNSRRTRERKA